MIDLVRAIDEVEARKEAIFGPAADPTLNVASDTFQQHALFSGLDVDVDEAKTYAERASRWYTKMAAYAGLESLFIACWIDAFLIACHAMQQTPDNGTEQD